MKQNFQNTLHFLIQKTCQWKIKILFDILIYFKTNFLARVWKTPFLASSSKIVYADNLTTQLDKESISFLVSFTQSISPASFQHNGLFWYDKSQFMTNKGTAVNISFSQALFLKSCTLAHLQTNRRPRTTAHAYYNTVKNDNPHS